MENSIIAFCANCQEETDHTVSTSTTNGEIILTCACERFIKLPPETTPEEAQSYLEAHKENNQGQITVEEYERAANNIVAAFNQAEAEEK